MKGVSPVVATVLLIAIAVVAAVGVWFWVAGLQNKPATPAETKMLQFEGCIREDPNNSNHTTLILRNPTAYTMNIPTSGVDVVDSNYNHYANVTDFPQVTPYGTVKVKLDTTLDQGAVYYMTFSDEAGNLPSIKILCQ